MVILGLLLWIGLVWLLGLSLWVLVGGCCGLICVCVFVTEFLIVV